MLNVLIYYIMKATDNTASAYVATKKTFSAMCDNELRGFAATVKVISKKAKENAASWSEIVNKNGITLEMFKMDYIRERLPLRFDESGRLCTLKKIAEEEAGNWEGFEVRHYEGFAVVLVPKYKFTTSEVITLVERAKKAEDKRISEIIKAKKAEEAEARKAERVAELEAKIARLKASK